MFLLLAGAALEKTLLLYCHIVTVTVFVISTCQNVMLFSTSTFYPYGSNGNSNNITITESKKPNPFYRQQRCYSFIINML